VGDILENAAEYDLARKALDVALTDADLPDATIILSTFLGAAEREIKQRDPLWAGRTGAEEIRLKAATAYMTAAFLAGSWRPLQELSESQGDVHSQTVTHRKKYAAWDAAALAAALRALAEAELAGYLETSGETDIPTMFALATGRRGR
jgi:hypothetical protein